MGLFKKKCVYCKKKIDRGKEVLRDVKDPVFVGTKPKSFCCEIHADSYEREITEYMKNKKSCRSGCC